MADEPTIPGSSAAPAVEVPLSYAAAESRKAEIMASAELRQAILDDQADISAEWRRITEALSRPPEVQTGRDELVAHINQSAGFSLPPDVQEMVRSGAPISPDERRMTLALWQEKLQDKEWQARLARKEVRAMRELSLIQINLAAAVKDPSQS